LVGLSWSGTTGRKARTRRFPDLYDDEDGELDDAGDDEVEWISLR
jgi:hypothetical protein